MLSRRLFLRRAAAAPLLVPSAVTALASLATPPVAAAAVDPRIFLPPLPQIAPGVYEGLLANARRHSIIQRYARIVPQLIADMKKQFGDQLYESPFIYESLKEPTP